MDVEPDCLPPPVAPLCEEEPPPMPEGLISGILLRVRVRLTLRDAVDLMTAGFARVLIDIWLPRSTRSERAESGDERER